MVRKRLIELVLGIFALANSAAVADVVVAYWDFGPDASGYTEAARIGNMNGAPTLTGMSAGTGYDADGQVGAAFVDVAGTNHNAGQALTWGSGVNDDNQEWILDIDLTGYQELQIRWDYRSTGTGPSGAELEYKVGAGSWESIESIVLSADSDYHTYERDLASISAIENQPSVQFKLSSFSGGSRSGTHRIDNLQLSAIPEPAVAAFIALTGLGALVVRRFVV